MGFTLFPTFGRHGFPTLRSKAPRTRADQKPYRSPFPTYEELRAMAAARNDTMNKSSFRIDVRPPTKSGAEQARDAMIQRGDSSAFRQDAAPQPVRSAKEARAAMVRRLRGW